jgi:hypothetical protein
VNCVVIIFTLDGAHRGARHPDRYLIRPHPNNHRWVLGYVLVPVVLNSDADANLPVQGQTRGSDVLISGRGVDLAQLNI